MYCNLATLPRTVEITCTTPQHPRDVLGGQRHCAWPHAGADNGGRWLCRTDRVRAAGEPLMLSGSDELTRWGHRPQPQIVIVVPSNFVRISVLSGGERGNKPGKKQGGPGARTALLKRATRLKWSQSSRRTW